MSFADLQICGSHTRRRRSDSCSSVCSTVRQTDRARVHVISRNVPHAIRTLVIYVRSPGGCVAASDGLTTRFWIDANFTYNLCTHTRARWIMQTRRAPSRIINLLKNHAQRNISMSQSCELFRAFASVCEMCLHWQCVCATQRRFRTTILQIDAYLMRYIRCETGARLALRMALEHYY